MEKVKFDLKTYTELFESQVRKTPDHTALIYEKKTLSYKELDAGSNQLAHLLREKGVGPETPVIVYSEHILEAPIAFLAIMKAGGVYVPVDSAMPEERVHYIVQDSKAPLALVQKSLLNHFPSGNTQILSLEETLTHSHLDTSPLSPLAKENHAPILCILLAQRVSPKVSF